MTRTDKKAKTSSLTVSQLVSAPPETVFRAWTVPSEIRKWWAPEDFTVPFVEVDLQVGGEYRLGLQRPDADPFHATGSYREIDAPRKLVFTWRWEPDQFGTGETLVTIEFRAHGQKTEVVLTHEGFPSAEARDEHQKGWTSCLERLGEVISALHGSPSRPLARDSLT